MKSWPHRVLTALLVTCALAPSAAAQRDNDPSLCPYCMGDPALMEASGIVSHGGFEFGISDTNAIDEFMPTLDIKWIETKYFEIGLAIGEHKVKQTEKEKIFNELTRLQQTLPAVNPKTKTLDLWLRSHLYAQRLEDLWTRFLEIIQIEDESVFPDGLKPIIVGPGRKYMGEGPYLGQKGKYELIVFRSEPQHTTFLKTQFGLLIRLSQRWNEIPRDTLILVTHLDQGGLRQDEALHGHVVFNFAINMLDGYKHYSYEIPVWLREGLAHVLEREINPKFNTFDSSEGAVAEMTRKENWEPEVRKLIQSGKALRMAELMQLRDYAGLTLNHHFTVWSMIDWLLKTRPDEFACFLDKIKGILNDDGVSDGSNMGNVHRKAIEECFGMNYLRFDQAWSTWVLENYATK